MPGYLLVGMVAANDAGKAAILFYLLAYAVTNLGAFGVVALLGTADRPHDTLNDFAGLWNRRPALAAVMTVFLLSLGGLPPTAGFIGKWYIFSAAVEGGYYWLAIIGVLTSVDLGLLLPSHCRDDVHDRGSGGRGCPAALAPRHRRARDRSGRRLLSWRAAFPCAGYRAGLDPDDFLDRIQNPEFRIQQKSVLMLQNRSQVQDDPIVFDPGDHRRGELPEPRLERVGREARPRDRDEHRRQLRARSAAAADRREPIDEIDA